MKESILITGGSGLLALNWAIAQRKKYSVILGINRRNIELAGVKSIQLPIESVDSIVESLNNIKPKFLIHTAGITSVEKCESDPDLAHYVNVELSKNVTEACIKTGVKLVYISTDHLFSGRTSRLSELDKPNPKNVYGETKAEAEKYIVDKCPNALIVRTNFFGWGLKHRESFSDRIINSLRNKKAITLFKDVYYTPILIETLSNIVHELCDSEEQGIYNVVGDDRISKLDFGYKIARHFSLDTNLIIPESISKKENLVQRPHDMSLSNSKLCKFLGRNIGDLESQLDSLYRQEQTGIARELAEVTPATKNMIPYGQHYIDEGDIQEVINVLRYGDITQGPKIEEFEKAIAEYVNVKYAVAVSSGTAALHLAALVAGVTSGHHLITSPITFVASANAALYNGGKVIFSDIDPQTINLCPDLLSDTLHKYKDIRAIVPVHFAGLPCDMPAIKSIADNYAVTVIEDASHALGAKYVDGNKVGSCVYSDMTTFSFHPVKTIAAGEGGMITTNDEVLHRKLLRLRSHGINKLDDQFEYSENEKEIGVSSSWYYEMQELGFNYRITDIQCALALSQFRKLDKFISRRSELVSKYNKVFSEMKNCCPAQQSIQDNSGHHLYVLRINFSALGISRSAFMQELRLNKIISQVHYIPVPAHPYYRKLGFKPEDYPNAFDYYQEALSIPLYYDLTDEQQQFVINVFKKLLT
jgi:UDP-4-amino-4,6-dideoxy-N-acetyl-beta-L-altrosamine transaminase/dTDP-4-dehydrorhamnose reductase